jgi:hypothetical protein
MHFNGFLFVQILFEPITAAVLFSCRANCFQFIIPNGSNFGMDSNVRYQALQRAPKEFPNQKFQPSNHVHM